MKPYYSNAGITLYHADCLTVLPLLAPGSVDAVVTDPPYGMNWNTDTTRFSGGNSQRAKDQAKGRIVGRDDWGDIIGDVAPFNPSPWMMFPRVVLWGANPFTGSGTTAVACIQTGRKFIGVEIEEKYCEIAVKRIERALRDKAAELPYPTPEPEPVQMAMFTEPQRT